MVLDQGHEISYCSSLESGRVSHVASSVLSRRPRKADSRESSEGELIIGILAEQELAFSWKANRKYNISLSFEKNLIQEKICAQ